MKRSSTRLSSLAFFLSAVLGLAACGEEAAEAAPEDMTPIVGLYELAISRNNDGAAPTAATRVEVNRSELRLNGTKVLDLTRGRPADGQVADHVITPLRTALAAAPSRARASLKVEASVPYLTLVETLNTLHGASLREVHIAVRTLGDAPQEGWMPLRNWRVAAHDEELEPATGPPWSAFGDHWREVYDACRAGSYIDCDGPYPTIAQGGTLGMELWTRGQGMKVTFRQTNPPEPEAAAGGGGGPALIEGVARAPAAAPNPEEEVIPATIGSFTVRHQDAVSETSALSNMSQLVCGNQSCRAEVVTDGGVASMRVVSLLGALFPNGFSEPQIVFRIPER